MRSVTPDGEAKVLTRENCVLVFGASGRTGKACVKSLLDSGRSVVAACRSTADLGIEAGEQENGAILWLEGGVDVTKANSIKTSIFNGVTQVCHWPSAQESERYITFHGVSVVLFLSNSRVSSFSLALAHHRQHVH